MVTDKNLEKTYPKSKKFIQKAIKHPGALHKSLGIPEGEKIPASKLVVHPGDSTHMMRMKNFAKTLKGMH